MSVIGGERADYETATGLEAASVIFAYEWTCTRDPNRPTRKTSSLDMNLFDAIAGSIFSY
jgi:hypothetical protein